MTATVTPPHIVDKFDDLTPMSGDNLTRLTYGLLDIRKPVGQLWERVAEGRKINYDVYPWPILDCAELYEANGNGPLISAHTGDGFGATGGIIRAGERIK